MRVLINGEAHELADGATVSEAIAAVAIAPPFAVAVNLQFVPKSQYKSTPLSSGDSIEMVSPVTGG